MAGCLIDGAGKDATVSYSMFGEGATTRDDGFCVGGCGGADFSQANANWLQNQLVGNSKSSGLDGMLTFMVDRETPIHGEIFGGGIGSFFEKLLSGPLAFWNDHCCGMSGMGAPSGRGDWAAMAHDFNYETNGITIGSYINPTISPQTAKALIQSNNTLIRNAGGFQGAKMGLFFGPVNAWQWYAHTF